MVVSQDSRVKEEKEPNLWQQIIYFQKRNVDYWSNYLPRTSLTLFETNDHEACYGESLYIETWTVCVLLIHWVEIPSSGVITFWQEI